MERTESTVNWTTGEGDLTSQYTCHSDSFVLETLNFTVPYIFNAALNVPSAITATIANILSFLAIRQSTTIHLPSKLLLCSLVLTDIGVGLVAQPLFVTFLIMRLRKAYSITCFFTKSYFLTSSLFGCVSLLMMTAISLDRYIAMFFNLKYHETVTSKRVSVLLTFIWSFSVFFASTWLWNRVLYDIIAIILIFACSFAACFSYIKIYRGLHRQIHDQEQPSSSTQATSNMAASRRTTYTMLWIYALFFLCYFPYVCAKVTFLIVKQSALTWCIFEFCKTLLLLNSCFNPFVYCFRLSEVRDSVVKQLRKCCRLCRDVGMENIIQNN